jgi:NADH-quinone oxidoreductase subunit L
MANLLQFFTWLPLFAFLVVLVMPHKWEKLIAKVSLISLGIYVTGIIAFTIYWLVQGMPTLDIKHLVLYRTTGFEFFIDFYFDRVTAVYAITGALIIFLVALFSRYYMHRDPGFRRYFSTLLFFFLGYNLVVFGGNFETLFIGWEILGLCSFLLIAFYRDRYLPVKNAMKVISVYRLGDVCLMLAMWGCHHLFHQNITFHQLAGSGFMENIEGDTGLLLFSGLMILVAAAIKSALIPFSSWLPRAMEGPTTSSAVFYGSLSAHLGVFLLLRTFPLWQNVVFIKVAIIVIGFITILVASGIARVQSTVKTQVAYASITQLGLITIEIALGLHMLALIHFAGNAFLRTYQLLVSPSVLHYRIHDMFFNHSPQTAKPSRFNKVFHALYVLNIREWNLDNMLYRYFWNPFKWVGKNMNFLVRRASLVILGFFFLFGLFSFAASETISPHVEQFLPLSFSVLGLLMVLAAFSERGDARRAWLFVSGGQGFITLAISLNEYVPAKEIIIYLSGVVIAAIGGLYCLNKLRAANQEIGLNRFHGYAYEKPVLAFLFLLCCMASFGFPITATFLGIDLLFTHIGKEQGVLLFLAASSFIFIELCLLRIYARIFLGPHKRNDHPIAFRSS